MEGGVEGLREGGREGDRCNDTAEGTVRNGNGAGSLSSVPGFGRNAGYTKQSGSSTPSPDVGKMRANDRTAHTISALTEKKNESPNINLSVRTALFQERHRHK